MLEFIAGVVVGMALMTMAQIPLQWRERKKDKFNVLSALKSSNFISGGQYEELLEKHCKISMPIDPDVEKKAKNQELKSSPHKTLEGKGIKVRTPLIPRKAGASRGDD